MKSTQASDLLLPILGATAGLSSSAKHQQDLQPDSVIGYKPGSYFPSLIANSSNISTTVAKSTSYWKMELAVWLKS